MPRAAAPTVPTGSAPQPLPDVEPTPASNPRDSWGAADGLRSAYEDARGRSLPAFNKAMDWLDGQAGRAPAHLQPRARQAIDAARQRPLLTTLGALGVGLLALGALTRRR